MAHRPVCLIPTPRLALLAVVALATFVATMAPVSGSELRETPIVRAVQRARPSVVSIRGEKTLAGATATASGKTDAGRRVNGMGTGVVIDSRGYILTNHHVVDGVREIQVTLDDGHRYVARLVERDSETDLAVIKIDSTDPLTVIPVGSSGDLMPGETVVAVGNAYGYDQTVTWGIISALHRAVQVSDAQFYEDLIQTDASINPGNSGGPLLNIDGDMIGINVAVRAGAQGIGFAIPVDKALAVATKLLAAHCDRSAWHGVVLAEPTSANPGAVVKAVEPASPAAQAGVQPGDVIAAVGDQPVVRAIDFYRGFLEQAPGTDLAVVVERGAEKVSLDLALAEPQKGSPAAGGTYWELLGLELKTIPPEQFRQQYESNYRGGLLVLAVRPDGPASAQGIRKGDVLVGMHIWETVSIDNVAYVINRPDFASFNPVKFYILRGNQARFGYLPVSSSRTVQR